MKKPRARERILHTAADLFTERGYGAVGINEIIEKSDTAKASFYHHFPSKEMLCITWLMDTHARSDARHDAILSSPGKAEDKIYEYFEGLKTWMKEKDFRGCPYTNTTASLDKESPKIAEQVELHKLSIRDFFTGWISRTEAGYALLFTLFWGHHRSSEFEIELANRCCHRLHPRSDSARNRRCILIGC